MGPSCLSLVGDADHAQVVADRAFTFEEFVVQAHEAGRFEAPWRADAGKALLHGHCHHKALVGNEVTVAALTAAGYDVEVIPSGCCGMAGDFGYETVLIASYSEILANRTYRRLILHQLAAITGARRSLFLLDQRQLFLHEAVHHLEAV